MWLAVTPLLLSICLAALDASSLKDFDPSQSVIHIAIRRNGGPVSFTDSDPTKDLVNLTHLAFHQSYVEARFDLTKREVSGNKLVRKVKNPSLLTEELRFGGYTTSSWSAAAYIGQPAQRISMDLDMLSSDFHLVTTRNSEGNIFHHTESETFEQMERHMSSACDLVSDVFHFRDQNISQRLEFAHCQPPKSSLASLTRSETRIGLAPSTDLSQTGAPSFFTQVLQQNLIKQPIFSIVLISGSEGILSLGGSTVVAIDKITRDIRARLDSLKGPASEETQAHANETIPDTAPEVMKRDHQSEDFKSEGFAMDEGWKWNAMQGADGWWQTLLQSIVVEGSRILKNQAVVFDLNSPLILAPPLAAKTFYASVPGAVNLPAPHDSFYAYPCLNPPKVDIQLNGQYFPFMRSTRGTFGNWADRPGGIFSLGRWREGSGYCIGAIVETRMGLQGGLLSNEPEKGNRRVTADSGSASWNGMRDVWVFGEGFFRGIGLAFDFKEQRIGLRVV